MGNKAPKPAPPPPSDTAPSSSPPPAAPAAAKGKGCPIRSRGTGSSATTSQASTTLSNAAASAAKDLPDACPMSGKKGADKQAAAGGGKTVYNVYAQPIDPTNQMPANPNQQPAPGQEVPLSTERVRSFIPKGGTEEETWTYPSPQMFWNALVRKGKSEDAKEEDMDVVVAIHNNMNENTWKAVLEWEALHSSSSSSANKESTLEQQQQQVVESRLSRFMGRPDDLSPKARLKSIFGHPLPFDRHDWIVERKSGEEVRYVIDYYHDDEAAKHNKVPKLHDPDAVKSITIDVRPAVDSLEALADRMFRMPLRILMGETKYRPLPFFKQGGGWGGLPQLTSGGGKEGKKEEEALDLQKTTEQIQTSCSTYLQAVKNCKGDDACSRASIELTYCMARLICKPQAEAFGKVWLDGKGRGQAVQMAYTDMQDCLDDFQEKAAAQRQQQQQRQGGGDKR